MPRFAPSTLLLPLAFSLGLPTFAYAAPPDSPYPSAQNPTMALAVDATESARHILHVQMDIPARAGALTLVYPKWLPGEHAPNGPIANVSGIIFTSGGQTLVWNRDLVDMFAFHLKVPDGANSVHAAFDLLTASDPAQAITSDNLADIAWTSLVLYPQGKTADTVNVAARLRLPAGWKFATALPIAGQSGDTVSFQPAPLSTFLDSPLIAGAYSKVIPLSAPGDTAPVEIDMVADSPDCLLMPDNQITAYKNLVTQAGALWGARHYRDYHFLYTLSDLVHGEGLEHHESSQDTVEADTFTDQPKRGSGDLLAHEYTHSWNGKYRRPYDLYTTDYQMPMRDDLLWVYEGMTEYYGLALTARSGLWTPEDYRDEVANIAAYLDHETGRAWRPLSDTAVSSQNLRANREWRLTRRAQDYYTEMVLIWLEADTIIRTQTHGQKSLDDFARLFGGGQSGPPQVVTYTLDDIAKTLGTVTPYDWKKFLQDRIYTITPRAPLGGITSSGWSLVYTDTQSALDKANEAHYGGLSLIYSLGVTLSKTGQIGDIAALSPAAQAGLAPGMKIVAVNGRGYTSGVIKAAIQDTKTQTAPLSLLVENGEFFKTYQINYHGGTQYPHLVRDPAKPDLLSRIVSPQPAVPVTAR